MRVPGTTNLVFVFVLALGPSFACATSSDGPKATSTPEPDPTPVSDAAGAVDAADAEVPSMSDTCTEDGFCYVPVPSLGPLQAVSASSVDDAWMVQQNDAILRWNRTALKVVYKYEGTTPPSIRFWAIWAEKKDNVWAAARGSDGYLFIVRYSSAADAGVPTFRELRTHQSSGVTAVWGTPTGDALWIMNNQGVLRVHEDTGGTIIENLTPPIPAGRTLYYLSGIWGFGPDDVYVSEVLCPSGICASTNQGVVGQGAIAHYDGTSWSTIIVESAPQMTIESIHGTPPGTDRQLWYTALELAPDKKTSVKTYLVPVTDEGLGTPLYTHTADNQMGCTTLVGAAATPSSGWFSDGLLLCRWTGTSLELAQTARGGIPVVDTLNGIWAGGADDAWVVGAAVTQAGQPARGFAARRTATTIKGGQP